MLRPALEYAGMTTRSAQLILRGSPLRIKGCWFLPFPASEESHAIHRQLRACRRFPTSGG